MFLSKCSNGFYYIYYDDFSGRRKSKSTRCKKKSEALKYLANISTNLLLESQSPLISITLAHFKLKFLAYSETINSWNHTKSMHSALNGLHNFFGDVTLLDLKKEDIQTYIEYRLRVVSSYSVRRDIHSFSSAFKWAVSKKYLKENISKGLPLPKLPEILPIYFTYEEFDTLVRSVENKNLLDIIIFAVSTGLRQSDLINLRWEQINFSNRTFILDNRYTLTKSRRVHVLPLNKTAFEIMERRKAQAMLPFVFAYNGNRVKQDFICKKFKKLVLKAGLNPKLTFHTLRHTFATRLVQKGVPIYQVSKLLTHSDIRVTQMYAHLCTRDLFEAVFVLDVV